MKPIIEQMPHFAPDVILEEEIFVPRNIGPNCDTIGNLLYNYGEKFILSALEDGEYSIAVDNYLHMLGSLTKHFIADEPCVLVPWQESLWQN